MPISLLQPVAIVKVMAPCALRNGAHQPVLVGVRDPDSVVTTAAQPPDQDSAHVKYLQGRHPVQKAAPQPLRALGIRRVGRAVGGAGNLDDDHTPTPSQELIAAHCVVGPVSIQAGHEDDSRAGSTALCRSLGYPDVDRDGVAVVALAVRVRHHGLLDRLGPGSAAAQVGRLLRLPGLPLDGAVDARVSRDIGEARDAVHGAGPEVQLRGLCATGSGGIGPGDERLGDGEKGPRVLGRGPIVDVVGDQVGKYGLKVFVFTVVEGIQTFCALFLLEEKAFLLVVSSFIFRGNFAVQKTTC